MDIQKMYTFNSSPQIRGVGSSSIEVAASRGKKKSAKPHTSTKDSFIKGSSNQVGNMPKPNESSKVEDTKAIQKEDTKPSVNPEDLKPYPKDLNRVSSDGKTKKVKFIYDTDNREYLDNLTLVGSWDKNTGHYKNDWKESEVPMQLDNKGKWIATLDLVDNGDHDWQWGVKADGPSGKQKWAVFEEGNLSLNMKDENPAAEYAPTTYNSMGTVKDGDNAKFKFWAPNAKNVKVRLWDKDPENPEYVPLEKDDKTGMWNAQVEGGWKKFEGKNYAFELETSEGKTQLKNDPYTRFLQGKQKGLEIMYLSPKSGKQVHQYFNENDRVKMARFEVQDQPDAKEVYVTLKDEQGNQLNKQALQERLGEFDSSLIDKFHEGSLNDFWANNVDDKGRIKMVKQGDAWASIVNSPDKLPGLSYQFEVYKEDNSNGQLKLVGDANNDNILSAQEAKSTTFNDMHSNKISKDFGWQRFGVIKSNDFAWKNDEVPRVKDKSKMVIYQMHTGSVFGEGKNTDKSTYEDIMNRLKYFKDLGVNTLELLPTNTFEGGRDWGYIGSQSLAQSEQYGFEDQDGKWVGGTEALKKFIDAAHGMGLNVVNDVVYNHWGGEFNNLWNLDGEKNPYFNWNPDPPVVPENQGNNEGIKHTDWGAMPAYNKEPVKQLIVDHALNQMDEFHFDGLRFDFTHPIHADGWGGGKEGWELLRKINKEIHYFHPDAITSAEEFPNSPALTNPAYSNGNGGAGFDTMWNTEHQHRLVHDHSNPSILQQAVKGWRTDMDKFMNHMVNHPGFSNHMNSVTVLSNHDEVGNADRTINVANDHQHGTSPSQWAKNASRLTFGVGTLSPGIPMFFQGEESMADNKFTWGIPATWDNGWDWLDTGKDWNWNKVDMSENKTNNFKKLLDKPEDSRSSSAEFKAMSETDKKVFEHLASKSPEERDQAIKNIERKQHHKFCQDIINLKNENPAFDGDAEVHKVYTHNDNSVMAFKRKKGDSEFLVIASLNKDNQHHYNIPLDGGKYELVLNSDSSYYGGENFGSTMYMDGNHGANFDIPKGGVMVYKRIE